MSFWRSFPNLQRSACRITSPPSRVYNCIAWAVGRDDAWWWPDPDALAFWPEGVERAETLAAVRQVFEQMGYVPIADRSLEPGKEKIAMFAAGETPSHAARQLSNGSWTSKLGRAEDIEHALEALEGGVYGTVVAILQRPRQ